MRKERRHRNVFPLNPRTLAAISASLAAAGLLSPAVHAQTWDDGGANTNWGTAANWSGDTLPATGTDVFFGSGGATATLDANYSVGTLTFNRAGDFTIDRAGASAFSLTINTGISVVLPSRTNRTYTISAPLILGGDNLWNFGNNSQGSNTGAVILSGGISETGGSRSVTKTGLGPVTLTAAGTYTGSTTITNGTFNLANNSATLTNSAVVLDGGATVALNVTNNATADDTTVNRIASLTLNGGEFRLTGPANFRTTEVIAGALTIGNGPSIITADANNRRAVIQAASLSRSAGGYTVFRGDALGSSAANAGGTSTESNIVFTSAPAASLFTGGGGAANSAQISILPWAVGDTGTGSLGSGFITYDAGADGIAGNADDRGIRQLNTTTEYAPTVSGAAVGDNVRIAANDTLAAGEVKAVNSLLVAGGGTGTGPALTLGSGSTLTISSGALLFTGTPNAGIVGAGTVNFGSATEAFITVNNTGDTKKFAANLQGAANTYKFGDANLDVSGVISDNGATAANLIIGQGRLTLSNPANTYTGTTTIQRGRLQLAASALKGSGSLGTSSSPIILGTDKSTQSENIELFLNSGVTLGRDIEARQPQVGNPDSQRYRIGIDSGTATVDTTSKVTIGAPAGTGTSRRLELVAVQSSAVLDFKGEIVQNGSAYAMLINGSNAGQGAVRLSNPNSSFSSSTQIVTGTLLLGASVPASGNSAIGTGSLSLGEGATQSNATLRLLTDGSFNFARALNLNSANAFTAVIGGNAAGSTSTFSGNITTTSDARTKNLQLFANAADTTVIFSGAIGANADATGVTNLEKTGDGTVLLSNASNTYDGTTTVSAGTLLVNGALSASPAAVTVDANGILGGTGTINRPTIINGTLSPGDSLSADTTNNLAFGDTLTFGASAVAAFQLGGTAANAFDKITVTGAFTLDGTVNVTLVGGFTPANGDVFDLFDFGSISATGFSVANDLNLPALGGGLSWNTDSFLTNGTIAVVPEPGTVCSLLGGVGLLMGWRRARQRK